MYLSANGTAMSHSGSSPEIHRLTARALLVKHGRRDGWYDRSELRHRRLGCGNNRLQQPRHDQSRSAAAVRRQGWGWRRERQPRRGKLTKLLCDPVCVQQSSDPLQVLPQGGTSGNWPAAGSTRFTLHSRKRRWRNSAPPPPKETPTHNEFTVFLFWRMKFKKNKNYLITVGYCL